MKIAIKVYGIDDDGRQGSILLERAYTTTADDLSGSLTQIAELLNLPAPEVAGNRLAWPELELVADYSIGA